MTLQSPTTIEMNSEVFTNQLADAFFAIEQVARSKGAESLNMAKRFLAEHAVKLLDDAGVKLFQGAGSAAGIDADLLWLDIHQDTGTMEKNSKRIEMLSLARPEERPFIAFLPIDDTVACIAVPPGGIQISSSPVPKTGLLELDFRELTVELPWEHFRVDRQLGAGAGAELFGQIGAEKWLLFSGVILGIVQRAFEYVLDYSRKRTAFGKAIGHHQAVALRLADIAIALESCRLLCQHACVSGNTGMRLFQQARCIWQYIKDTIREAAPQTMQVMGGHGYLQEHPVQQWFCDLQLLLLAGELPDSFANALQHD